MLARIFGNAEPWSLLPLRIVLGLVFVVHAVQKILDFGVSGFAEFLGQIGVPAALVFSVVVILVELLGGISLLVGFLTRWAALLLAIDMLVATLVVHLPNGFFYVNNRGFEFTLVLLGACLTILLTGAKKPSIDARLPREI